MAIADPVERAADPGSVRTTGDAHTRSAPARTRIRIQASAGWRSLALQELWRYRELIYFLAWRDVKVRYKQTLLGIAWAVLQPLVAMVIFSIFFGALVKVPSEGVPYPLFAYLGMLPWTYFANATSAAGGSLVANTNLISKVYFPRLVVPIAAIVAGLVDLAIGVVLLGGVLAFFGRVPGPTVLFLFPLVALAMLTALAVGIWLSALDVQYRDVKHATPFLIQVWMFATPVVYPSSLLSESQRVWYGLNPMAGVVEGFRWAVLGQGTPPTALMGVSTFVSIAVLLSGLFYFRRVERGFADLV